MLDGPIRIGDVVMLRSGGPKMTVYKILATMCFCTWFEDRKLRNGEFHPDMLMLPRKPNAERRSQERGHR